jgi:hypothetical protein
MNRWLDNRCPGRCTLAVQSLVILRGSVARNFLIGQLDHDAAAASRHRETAPLPTPGPWPARRGDQGRKIRIEPAVALRPTPANRSASGDRETKLTGLDQVVQIAADAARFKAVSPESLPRVNLTLVFRNTSDRDIKFWIDGTEPGRSRPVCA